MRSQVPSLDLEGSERGGKKGEESESIREEEKGRDVPVGPTGLMVPGSLQPTGHTVVIVWDTPSTFDPDDHGSQPDPSLTPTSCFLVPLLRSSRLLKLRFKGKPRLRLRTDLRPYSLFVLPSSAQPFSFGST